MIRHVDELLHECRQLRSADAADNTTAAGAAAGAETRRYDTLMQRYCDNVTSIANLVAMTTESIQKRDSLNVSCCLFTDSLIHTPFTHPFNGPLSGTTQVSRYQKGKTKLDFTEARDSEWQ